jgi:hypothetical protein
MKPTTHRVVTFLTREQVDFLDKLEKDMMFSTGKSVPRSQIIQDLAELLGRTGMDAFGVHSNEELMRKMLEALRWLAKQQETNNETK